MGAFFHWIGQLPAPLYWVTIVTLVIVCLPIFWFFFAVVMVVADGGNGPAGGLLEFIGLGAIGSFVLALFFLPSLLYLQLGLGSGSYFLGVVTSIILSFGGYFAVAYRDYRREIKRNASQEAETAAKPLIYDDQWLCEQGETALSLEIDWGRSALAKSKFLPLPGAREKHILICDREGIRVVLRSFGEVTAFTPLTTRSADFSAGVLAYLDVTQKEGKLAHLEVIMCADSYLLFRYSDRTVALTKPGPDAPFLKAVAASWNKALHGAPGYSLR